MLRIWKAFKINFTKHPAKLIHAHTLMVDGLTVYWVQNNWGVQYSINTLME
jgi:hypothetical protein